MNQPKTIPSKIKNLSDSKSFKMSIIFESLIIFATNIYFQKFFKNYDLSDLNPQAPDQFIPSRARCAENCGIALVI